MNLPFVPLLAELEIERAVLFDRLEAPTLSEERQQCLIQLAQGISRG
jgi:hypothetical protein